MNTHLGQCSFVQIAQLYCRVLKINIDNMKKKHFGCVSKHVLFFKITQPIFLLLWGLRLLIMLLWDCKEWEQGLWVALRVTILCCIFQSSTIKIDDLSTCQWENWKTESVGSCQALILSTNLTLGKSLNLPVPSFLIYETDNKTFFLPTDQWGN